eukprot:scaffold95139_cov65-Phaeocystis_antarctica.AAC.5
MVSHTTRLVCYAIPRCPGPSHPDTKHLWHAALLPGHPPVGLVSQCRHSGPHLGRVRCSNRQEWDHLDQSHAARQIEAVRGGQFSRVLRRMDRHLHLQAAALAILRLAHRMAVVHPRDEKVEEASRRSRLAVRYVAHKEFARRAASAGPNGVQVAAAVVLIDCTQCVSTQSVVHAVCGPRSVTHATGPPADGTQVGQPQPHQVLRGVADLRRNPPVLWSADQGTHEAVELRPRLQPSDDDLGADVQEVLAKNRTHARVALAVAARGERVGASVPGSVLHSKESSLIGERVEASLHAAPARRV